MAGDNRREAAQVARDRKKIAGLYLKGWLQVDIAQEVGIDQSTVSRDLKAIRDEWLKSTLVDFNEAEGRELAKIDAVEVEAWAAFERSKEDREISVQESVDGDSNRQKAQIRTEGRDGDPKWLEIVLKCSEQRRKILGIDAPVKSEVTGKDGGPLHMNIENFMKAKQELAEWEQDWEGGSDGNDSGGPEDSAA